MQPLNCLALANELMHVAFAQSVHSNMHGAIVDAISLYF